MKKFDLIFHLVSKRKWKEWQQRGYFSPEFAGESDKWIECYTAENVEENANRKFRERKNILILVINVNRLSSRIEFREKEGKQYPMIEKRINLDAIIDKIVLVPDENGEFSIKVEVK
jgi:uncharacterized protein (DUF952 family)